MLRLLLILAISLYALASEAAGSIEALQGFSGKLPSIVHSRKVVMNKVLDLITYEGDVKLFYDDYVLITDKMIIAVQKTRDSKLLLNYLDFPSQTKLMSKTSGEVIILSDAHYDYKKMELFSDKEIIIQREDSFFKAESILIQVGPPKDFIGVQPNIEQYNE